MGVECVSVPSRATHLMFLPVLEAKEPGRPLSSEPMFRDQAWPHCGWSAAQARKPPAPRPRPQENATLKIANRRPTRWRPQRRWNKTGKARDQLLFMGDDLTGNPNRLEGTRLLCAFQREMSVCRSTRNWCRCKTCSAISLSSMLKPRMDFPCGWGIKEQR